MTKPFLLGIDAGTSMVKSVVFDLAGKEVGLSRSRVAVQTKKPGWAEQDMQAVWEAVKETIIDCLTANRISGQDIAAIGITGQGDGCRLIDRQGRPIRNAMLWTDGRAADIINEWEEDGLADEIFGVTGSAVFSGAPAAIFKWFERNEPDVLQNAAHFLFAKDWIKYKLCGQIVTDPSDASRAAFDIRNGRYSTALFESLGQSQYLDLFPPIRPSSAVIGEVTRNAAQNTGLAAGTPVINGMIDVVACALGLGAVNHGQAYTIVGTTCFNAIILEEINLAPMGIGMSLAHALDRHMVRAMPSLAGTPNLDWFVEQFFSRGDNETGDHQAGLFDFLERKIREVPVGSGGVLFHPYISPGGERAPFVKPSATAQFFGLKLMHNKWHMLRAVYEGVALSILDCFEHMPVDISDIMMCGGGARSDLWCQIISDATGKTVNRFSGDEQGALGVSMAAGLGIKAYPTINDAIQHFISDESLFTPVKKNHRIYRDLYGLYKSLCEHQWKDWDMRARMVRKHRKLPA